MQWHQLKQCTQENVGSKEPSQYRSVFKYVGRWFAVILIPPYFYSYLHTQMNVSCQAKLPDVFDVRVTGIGLRLLKETVIPYNHSTVENFNITVNVGVEVCTDLRMKIRGRDSAGRTGYTWHPYTAHCVYCNVPAFSQCDLLRLSPQYPSCIPLVIGTYSYGNLILRPFDCKYGRARERPGVYKSNMNYIDSG